MLNQKGFSYSYPLRPNYHLYSFYIWVVGGFLAWWMQAYAPYFPSWPFRFWLGVCLAVALVRMAQGLIFARRKSRMERTPVEMISWDTLKRKGKGKVLWLGKAFSWSPAAIQVAWDILKSGNTKLLQLSQGHWIHGLGKKERDLFIPIELLNGHTLIVGSTRTGKTRLLDLIISQAIIRGEAVIILDPKGDHDLRDNARLACERLGKLDKFKFFHPNFPDKSVRLGPLRNFNRATELASRVGALIPSKTMNDPFKDFGWQVLNAVIQGMVFIGKRPNLINLRQYIEGGVKGLLRQTLVYYYDAYWNEHVGRTNLKDLISRYREDSQKKFSDAINGLITMHEHNNEHFQKMISSLIPKLSQLTSGTLQTLLSPGIDDSDLYDMEDLASIVEDKDVLFMGLDNLGDATVGSAIGSFIIAGLTAVASERYNDEERKRRDDFPPVNVIVDEAGELVDKPMVQLLNKGAGAGFRVVMATQTLADLEVQTGTASAAEQMIGNLNNWLILRIIDSKTQKYIAEALPKTAVNSMDLAYRSASDSSSPLSFSTTYQESLKEKDIELFPSALLGLLPPGHLFIRLSDGTTWKGRLPILEHEKAKEKDMTPVTNYDPDQLTPSQPGVAAS
ncbi:MAG: conjugative transfer system coupling protein TraD [Desulfobaccales bacterium]